MRHPSSMGGPEIEQFLTDLAVNGHVAASTQNQAFNALLFLYGQVLGLELPRLDAVRAKRPQRLPSVLDPHEVRRLLDAVQGGDGVFQLMARLLYGAGLRRLECCQIRVHDLDLSRQQITVRHSKGASSCCCDRCDRSWSGSWHGGGSCTSGTGRTGWREWRCPMRWRGSIRGRPWSWAGSSCSHRGSVREIRRPGGEGETAGTLFS
jgi:hypothetical protein